MVTTKIRRNPAIELLRIVAMLSIIVFHGHLHFGSDKLKLPQISDVFINNMFNYNILFSYFVGWGEHLVMLYLF